MSGLVHGWLSFDDGMHGWVLVAFAEVTSIFFLPKVIGIWLGGDLQTDTKKAGA